MQSFIIGQVLLRIAGKIVVSVLLEDIISSVGSVQTCTGDGVSCEVAVHAQHYIFYEKDNTNLLLIDLGNELNTINWNEFLHDNAIVCLTISS